MIKQLHELKDEALRLDINLWLYKKMAQQKNKTLELNDVFTFFQDLIVEANKTNIPKKTNFIGSGYIKELDYQ